MTIPDKSVGFSLKKGYKKPLALPGHQFQMNVQRRVAVVLALELEYQYQLLIAQRLLEEETAPVTQSRISDGL